MGSRQLAKSSFSIFDSNKFLKVRGGHLVQLLKQLSVFQWQAEVLNPLSAAAPSSGSLVLAKTHQADALSSSQCLLKTFFCCAAREPLPSVRQVVSCSEVCLLYSYSVFPIHSHPVVCLFHPSLLSQPIRTLLDLLSTNSFLLLFAKHLSKWNPFLWGF